MAGQTSCGTSVSCGLDDVRPCKEAYLDNLMALARYSEAMSKCPASMQSAPLLLLSIKAENGIVCMFLALISFQALVVVLSVSVSFGSYRIFY
jgi:hypothetical protein